MLVFGTRNLSQANQAYLTALLNTWLRRTQNLPSGNVIQQLWCLRFHEPLATHQGQLLTSCCLPGALLQGYSMSTENDAELQQLSQPWTQSSGAPGLSLCVFVCRLCTNFTVQLPLTDTCTITLSPQHRRWSLLKPQRRRLCNPDSFHRGAWNAS